MMGCKSSCRVRAGGQESETGGSAGQERLAQGLCSPRCRLRRHQLVHSSALSLLQRFANFPRLAVATLGVPAVRV